MTHYKNATGTKRLEMQMEQKALQRVRCCLKALVIPILEMEILNGF